MVECTALEMRRAREGTEGSNPSLSARSSSASVRGCSQIADFLDIKPLRGPGGVRARSQAFMVIHGMRHGMISGIHGIGGGNAE